MIYICITLHKFSNITTHVSTKECGRRIHCLNSSIIKHYIPKNKISIFDITIGNTNICSLRVKPFILLLLGTKAITDSHREQDDQQNDSFLKFKRLVQNGLER